DSISLSIPAPVVKVPVRTPGEKMRVDPSPADSRNSAHSECRLPCLDQDAAFGEIFRELEYKANWYGRTYLPLDRFFPSSKLCSSCGHLLDELPLSIREWDCQACGGRHDRDINAAINIKRAGQYLLKTTGSGARKGTPTRDQRRRSGVG